MSWRVPLVEVTVAEEDVDAVLGTLRTGWLTMGPVTQELEGAFAEKAGTAHAIAVSSGTAALHLACLAAGVGPGDEVLVPDLSFVASAHAPRCAGAVPVLCDSRSPQDPSVSAEDAEARITPHTRALVAVHPFGYAAADLGALRELCDRRELTLIEDCTEAIGAVDRDGRAVGTVGELGCFSLSGAGQLPVGEGGIVVTDDDAAAARLRSLRSHAMTTLTWERHRGHAEGYDVTEPGFNYRIDEPRAALGLSRLGRLDGDLDERRRVAREYRRLLAGVDGIDLLWDDDAVERGSHFAFPVLAADADAGDALRAGIHGRGVQTMRRPAIHTLTEYSGDPPARPLAAAEDAANRHLALPVFPGLSAERIELVATALREALAEL